jgi:hypothetical protein
MQRAKILATLAIASVCCAGTAPRSDFEFKWKGVCSDRDSKQHDKLTLKRGRDGVVQARIATTSYCIGGDYTADVMYPTDQVQLRADRDCEMIAVDIACREELTFRLKSTIARGTLIVFGFGSNEPHLRAAVP